QAWTEKMSPADYQLVARTADDLGFDAIVIPEHIVLPTSLEAAMGSHWPHAWTVMAFVAGATTRIRVNSSVIVLPYHDPIVLAKAVATLDVPSGGRVMLAIGVGRAEGEFEALGVPYHERGRMTDEYLEVMRLLWSDAEARFEGRYVSFKDVVFEP